MMVDTHKRIQTHGITLKKIPKKGGIYSTKLIRQLKRIYIKLGIEDRFDEDELVKYARFYLEEMKFLGKAELQKKEPNANYFYEKCMEFPYVRTKKNRRNQSRMIVEGKIDSYKKAIDIVGSLSKPSKIPTYGYALPVSTCNVGGKLHERENTTCSECYGFNGWYSQPWVVVAMEKRSLAIFKEDWVDAMVFLIKYHELEEFRWHDTGDLMSLEHFEKIVKVAFRCPTVKFWLPTQEKGVIFQYWEKIGRIDLRKKIPNLKIRLSAIEINKVPDISFINKVGILGSMVSDGTKVDVNCIASIQNNQCKDCRKCWTNEPLIVYRKH